MVIGTGIIVLLGYTYVLGFAIGATNPFNYFGYFTNLTSLVTAVLMIVSGAFLTRDRALSSPLIMARAVAAACMLLVGVVYNTLVPGTGSAPPWVSAVLHVIFPLLVVLDWTLVGDRESLPWRRLWWTVPYPTLWLTVVLVRGATDGWVPYGFLLPSRGALSLVLHVCGLLAALTAFAAVIWALSRVPAAVRMPVATPTPQAAASVDQRAIDQP